jgi:hypothetical protein
MLLGPDSGGPEPPPGTIYAVDITGLSDFATFVQQEFDCTFAPGRRRVEQDSAGGFRWAATVPGDLVHASQMASYHSQRQMMGNLYQYLNTSTAMVEALRQLMTTYKTADELAGVSPKQILDALSAALPTHTVSRIPRQTGSEG